MASRDSWSEEHVAKEKQRPPIYNPEDYTLSLKKWSKKCQPGDPGLYSALMEPNPNPQDSQKARTLPNQGSKDYRNPCLSPGEEMSLRQFGSASELLNKLRADLRLAFPSFVQEFVCEPLDGVSLLLELLRAVQLSQAGPPNTLTGDGGSARGPPQRPSPAIQRRALLDELACLQCIWSCCSRYNEASRRLSARAGGLYALASCIMSSVNKSRVLALQLLTKSCNPPANGHTAVSEALSTLRLRFGEPVRFRFLVGMLSSAGGVELPAAGLAFINTLLATAPTPQRKLYIQAELEQAGFDIVTFRKLNSKTTNGELIMAEIEHYEQQLIDVDTLSEKATEAEKEKHDLKSKLELLEKRVKILQEEKGILKSLEKCLKEKCCELQEEVSSLRSEHGDSNRKKSHEQMCRDESSPPEDEGISSSERSLSPDDDMQRESRIYEVYNVKNETFDMLRNKSIHNKLEAKRNISKLKTHKRNSEEEDETTIEEVIEELRNIVNDAESEQYVKDKTYDEKASRSNQKSEINVSIKGYDEKHKVLEKEDSITSTRHSIHISDSTEYLNDKIEDDSELEIVPTKIYPQPPRKSKSLVHLFVPPADEGIIYNRRDLLYEDACYSSDEGSDSLLSASRYQNQYQNGSAYDVHDMCGTPNNRNILNSIMDARDRTFDKRDTRRTRTRSGDEHLCRKASLKRSDSFQLSEKMHEYGNNRYGKCQLEDMFYPETDTAQFGSINPGVMRSDSKLSRKGEADINALIEAKKLTKSLDRIDEGLDSMVDIIMTSENRRMDWPTGWRPNRSNSRPNSDIGNHSSITQKSKPNVKKSHSHYRNESKSSKSKSRDELSSGVKQTPDSHQRFLIPQPKLSSASNDNNSNSSYNNSSSFIIKRNSNNGFYSGQHFLRDAPASMTSLGLNGGNVHLEMKRALSPTSSNNNLKNNAVIIQKVTDMPSGLY